jgi:hypothetical protein
MHLLKRRDGFQLAAVPPTHRQRLPLDVTTSMSVAAQKATTLETARCANARN